MRATEILSLVTIGMKLLDMLGARKVMDSVFDALIRLIDGIGEEDKKECIDCGTGVRKSIGVELAGMKTELLVAKSKVSEILDVENKA